jgi:S-formylglutathione hydrolase FrmB
VHAAWTWLTSLSLVHGAVPAVLVAATAVGLLLLLRSPGPQRRYRRSLPVAAPAAALLLTVAWLALRLLRPFPDALPWTVLAWVGVALLSVCLAGAAWRKASWRGRMVSVLAVALVVTGAAGQVNREYAPFPTIAAALQLPPQDVVPASSVLQATPTLAAPPGHGALVQVDIPNAVSHFPARPGWVYVPPAYLTAQRPLLPLLVLLGGQPGSPRDWVDGGSVARTMDAFAAAHHGLAPVVVMPDDLGGETANPLCTDSRLGTADTYLARDVPAWIGSALRVDPNHTRWAVGGFSYGGTCALQLSVAHPDLFPTFVDISGQRSPTLGDPSMTIRRAFGGNAAAYAAVDPMRELTGHAYPTTAAFLTAGSRDTAARSDAAAVRNALTAAGATASVTVLPGGHSWAVAGAALDRALPWLAARWGLVPRPPPPLHRPPAPHGAARR